MTKMQNRYEEYMSFDDNIPFIIHQNLKRTGRIYSSEANFHENIELQLCIDGEGRVLIDGKHIPFKKGEMVAINSGAIHHTGSDCFLEYSCIIIDQCFCLDSGIMAEKLYLETCLEDDGLKNIFNEMCRVYNEKGDCLRAAKLRRLTLELLILLCEKHTIQNEMPSENVKNDDVKKAINYIKAHFHEKISLDGIAKALYTNKYVLSRRFKLTVGTSIFDYICAYRCNTASRLISQGKSVTEAAHECGFENMSYFSRAFKQYMGKLPSECKPK